MRPRFGCEVGIIKQWREGNRLRRRARTDPAIRADWIRLYDSVYTEVRTNSHLPSTWRSIFENLEGGPPCRQELEWWRAMYMKMLDPRTAVMHTAAVEAIKELLQDAPDGPSAERYP